MKFFVESIDRKIWNVITNSYLIPISENVSSEREHLDCVAMNIIVSALDSNELFKVSECSSVKEMWNTLELYHKNPWSALMDKEESSVESFSSESRKEVCLMTKEESESSQARRKRKQNKKEANLCLMANEEDDASSVSFCTSLNAENYSKLFQAFNETHKEANRLTLLNKRLKGLNNSLENRVKTLEEELNHSKTDFESLEMIYENSSCKCDSSFCENCESFQKKVHYLSKGQSNLKTVLASQKCVFGKAGLGFNPTARTNLFQNAFQVSLKNNLLFYRNNRLKFVITA